MTTSPAPFTGAGREPHLGLSEWLRLRRHPFPEFFSSLRELPPGLLGLVQPALPSARTFQGALVLPGEYYRAQEDSLGIRARTSLSLPRGRSALRDCGRRPRTLALKSWRSTHGPFCTSGPACCCSTACWSSRRIAVAWRLRCDWSTTPLSGKRCAGRWPVYRRCRRPVSVPGNDDAVGVSEGNNASMLAIPSSSPTACATTRWNPGELLHAAVFQPAIWAAARHSSSAGYAQHLVRAD